jgi:hypothetical protein
MAKGRWKSVARGWAAVGVVFNVVSAPKPPDLSPQEKHQKLHLQWAKDQKVNRLPGHTRRAVELGEHLREPVSSERRPPEPDAFDRRLASPPPSDQGRREPSGRER